MVRLLGKIAEKQILPTHDTILKHGTHVAGTGNASVDSGTTMEFQIAGFSSVKKAWFTYRMKKGPYPNETIGVGVPILWQSDEPTLSNRLIVLYSSVGVGTVTIDWFAIGD